MGHFDVPNTGYGTYFSPVMIFTEVSEDDLKFIVDKCDALEINHQRWIIVTFNEIVHLKLSPGKIVYYPQYNCVRGANHFNDVDILSFDDFVSKLRKHPQHLGSMFIKTTDWPFRNTLITYFKAKGYRISETMPLFDHELAVLVNEPLKTLMVHRNERADENAKEGYPVMTYDEFKIYMA